MQYRKIALEVVVSDDEAEVLIQALNDAMDNIGDQVTVFNSSIIVLETGEPEKAAEIAAPRNSSSSE